MKIKFVNTSIGNNLYQITVTILNTTKKFKHLNDLLEYEFIIFYKLKKLLNTLLLIY